MKAELSRPLKILLVEDDSPDREELQRLLAESDLAICEVRFAESLDAACQLPGKNDCDVVLLDLNLPDSMGEDTLIRISKEYPHAAYIAVTAEESDDPAPKIVFKSAHEYLIKGKYDVYMLSKSIRYGIERKKAEQQQAQLLNQLESTNKELKDFAYIVSHDLKAPLRGIRTLVKWITTDYADRLDEDGKEQLNLLLSRVDRMHNLIAGVLQYSRIGRIREEKVYVNLNEVVSEVIDMVAVPENITVTMDTKLPLIECEETRIIQVFQNLLSNAVKYMDKPNGEIEIHCTEEGDFWKFSIADNGPGIEEKHFEKIFQMFQTLSPRNDFESTGVGLTVVKKIVELYGGNIWVESKLGKGSTFFFTLPKQEARLKDEKLQTNIVA